MAIWPSSINVELEEVIMRIILSIILFGGLLISCGENPRFSEQELGDAPPVKLTFEQNDETTNSADATIEDSGSYASENFDIFASNINGENVEGDPLLTSDDIESGFENGGIASNPENLLPILDSEGNPIFPSSGGSEESADVNVKRCAKLSGVPVSYVKIAGSLNNIELHPASVVFLKVTGNLNRATLNLISNQENTMGGLCVFLAGNQAEVKVKTNIILEKLVYIGRGNESKGLFTIESTGNIQQSYIDLSGNQNAVYFNSENDDFTCPTAKVRGDALGVVCE